MKGILKKLSFLLMFLACCAKNPVTGKKEVRIFSDKDEIVFGKEVYQSVIKEYGIYQNKNYETLVNEIGFKLAAHTERKLPYSFTLLNTNMINAFAAPGGYVFVTKGLLEFIENEDELACVIGHELGHINARHSMKAVEKQYGYEILFSIISAITEKDLTSLKEYADATFGLIMLGYGRDNEFQADELGIIYAKRAGFKPDAMIAFFNKLKKLEPSKPTSLEKLFLSHPPTDERIKRIQKKISTI